jgi:inner membrane protease ATP23
MATSAGSPTGAAPPLSPELTEQRRHCENGLEAALRTNKKVRSLLTAIEAMGGCPLPQSFFSCQTCDAVMSGGMTFTTDHTKDGTPHIIICDNKGMDKDTLESTVVHELVHALDKCRVNKFNTNNCEMMACTEIRASNLSGECSFAMELVRGRLSLLDGHADCVKRRAELSLSAQPRCRVCFRY